MSLISRPRQVPFCYQSWFGGRHFLPLSCDGGHFFGGQVSVNQLFSRSIIVAVKRRFPMHHFDENAFESKESAHEYLRLLSQVVKSAKEDLDHDVDRESTNAKPSRRLH